MIEYDRTPWGTVPLDPNELDRRMLERRRNRRKPISGAARLMTWAGVALWCYVAYMIVWGVMR